MEEAASRRTWRRLRRACERGGRIDGIMEISSAVWVVGESWQIDGEVLAFEWS